LAFAHDPGRTITSVTRINGQLAQFRQPQTSIQEQKRIALLRRSGIAASKNPFRSPSEYTFGIVFGFLGAASDVRGFTVMLPSVFSQLKKALTPRA
jgi:hypothetical protein